MIPCLDKDALKLLVGTADERYSYSPDYFRKTHFPQVMHRYHGNKLIAEITENELFEDLVEADSEGNRVFFLFGSTGSGKSELLCWVKDKWQLHQVNRPVIRISRTELNPQVLIKKCFAALDIPLEISIDETRWELLLKKPITLINQIVWSTLSEILPTDEEIVPIALMIRPIIEKNVTEFTRQVQNGRIKKPLEVLHQFQFEELVLSTTLQIPIEYPSFRKTLSQKLDQFLFEGRDIGSLFKQLTEQLKKINLRPLLLIDDLVQSVNIYATDLLDQLITLDEGNWDVVIGLTPGSVQGTDKGFNLTQRIQNLDTITDRVKKLWLSDESGKDFYSLDRIQVTTYMSNYLVQLKASQGFTCSSHCPRYSECERIARSARETEEDKLEQDINLLPFNRHLVKRTFDAIPVGKGKLRYMILNSKEIIRFFQKGKKEWVSRVLPMVKREKFSDHSDLFLKTYAEWYVPEEQMDCLIPKEVLHYFGYQDDDMRIRLYPLESKDETNPKLVTREELQQSNPDKSTVREWVEGKQINPELLDPVRLGVSTLIHDVVKGINISRQFTPRMTATIQRKNVMNRTRYPITFDAKRGGLKRIVVNRGYASLQISNFQLLKYSNKAKVFQQIANECETASWIYQAEELKNDWKDELEKALGLSVASFVYLLKNWIEACSIFENAQWIADIKNQFPVNQEMISFIEQSYQDWYLLRDNMFEPVDSRRVPQVEFDQWLKNYSPVRELEHYQIGEISLYAFLLRLKTDYLSYLNLLDHRLKKQLHTRQAMIPFLLGSQNKEYHMYADKIREFEKMMNFTLQDYVDYARFEERLQEEGITNTFAINVSLYQDVVQIFRRFEVLCEEVQSIMGEFDEIPTNNWNTFTPSWSNLAMKKEELLQCIDALAFLNNSLSTARSAWLPVLRSEYVLDDVLLVKAIWSRLVKSAKQLVMQQQTTNLDFQKDIIAWKDIDFYGIKARIEELKLREVEKLNIIKHLQVDLRCGEIESLDDLMRIIELNKELRPRVKRHLKALLEQGYTILPPVQWKRLLDELKTRFPTLFELVEIRLVASGK
ncbi:P-loop NTPase fold protein [Paenibacillus sp. ALE2]